MKFEYDGAEDQRECVAFIESGRLYVKTDIGCVVICNDEPPASYGNIVWDMRIVRAIRKFYPGDKITITF